MIPKLWCTNMDQPEWSNSMVDTSDVAGIGASSTRVTLIANPNWRRETIWLRRRINTDFALPL